MCLFSSYLQRRRGSVLVVVLVTIMFAAMLLTRLVESSSTDLVIAMRVADRDHLRAEAYGALETTLAVLEDFKTVDKGLYAPTQGWDDPLTYAEYTPREGVTLEVTFEDESAKLSLPRMNVDALNALLVQLGLATADAERVADALFVWTHEGHVAGEAATAPSVYKQLDPPSLPPYRSLRSFDELAGIAVARDFFYDTEGKPTQLWHDFGQAVSLYQFSATNLNTAGPTVLLASGWDATQADSLQSYLSSKQIATKAKPYLRSFDEARRQVGNVANRNLGAQVQCLRVIIDAREGAAQLRVSALVTWSDQATLPGSVATKGTKTTSATARKAAASKEKQNQPAPANTLRYPFTVLELSETSLPAPLPPPA